MIFQDPQASLNERAKVSYTWARACRMSGPT